VVAEGYTDVIAMHQAGLRHTVGLMGTALTDEQVGELARLAPTVLLALDADAAGQEAMLRGARVAARRNLALRVVPLPPGSDPADLVAAEGPRAMADRVDASVPFVRFRVERELGAGDLSSAEGKDAVIAALRPVFAQIPPSAMREELVGLVADRTELAPALVASWLAEGGRRESAPAGNGAPRPPAAASPAALDGLGRAERAFLAQCLAAPEAGRAALAELDLDAWFSTDLMRRAAARLRGELQSGTSDYPDDEELGRLIAELRVQSGGMPSSQAVLEAEQLGLELQRLKRDIDAAKVAAAGDVSRLVSRREELERRRDAAIARYMDETHVASE
jgi:DNA primase